jgi:hypothetical protein
MGAKVFYYVEKISEWLKENNSGDLCIIEIGSERGEGSTLFLSNYCVKNNISFYTVDIDDNSYNDANKICNNIQIKNNQEIQAFHMTGESFLSNIFPSKNKKILFMYLDNFDYIYDAIVEADFVKKQIEDYKNKGFEMNNENSKQAHLMQMKLAYPYMNNKSYVLFDDTYKRHNSSNWDGKGGYAVEFLFEKNWKTYICNESPDAHWFGYIMLEN